VRCTHDDGTMMASIHSHCPRNPDTSPPSLLHTPRTSTIASMSLEAIHQNDASQIAQGEVVSCNYRPNPALLIGWAGAWIPVEGYVCVSRYSGHLAVSR
jgi:hypothetical protein